MDLRLYDTLTREKRPFVPLDPNNVRMYVCGPTVYDFAHIGNARPVIVFDVLFRLLRHLHGADRSEEHVEDDRRAGIADMGEVVDGRAADIHAHIVGIDRCELDLFARQRIVEFKFHRPESQCAPPEPTGRACLGLDDEKRRPQPAIVASE